MGASGQQGRNPLFYKYKKTCQNIASSIISKNKEGSVVDKIRSNFIRGLWLAIVGGIIYSVVAWGAGLVGALASLVGIRESVAILLLPFVFVAIGAISQTKFIPWLSARFQSSVVRSMMRRFESDEQDDPNEPDSWTGNEVAVALSDGCYHNGNVPAMQKFGIVTATFEECGIHFVNVQFIYPPTGTGEVMTIRQDSCRIRRTGRSSVDHMATVSSLGRIRRTIVAPPPAKMKPHLVDDSAKASSSATCLKAPQASVPCKTEKFTGSSVVKFLKMNRF